MNLLLSKEMLRYIFRSTVIVLGTQIVFFALLATSLHNSLANFLALGSMLFPGLWLDKRFVFKNWEPFTFVEVKEFLTASISPMVLSPVVVQIAGDRPEYILSGVSVSVFALFWLLKFLLHHERWNS